MHKPQLYGTPVSHFTRKIRVLFKELSVDYDFVRATGVLGTDAEAYGDNPLMRVPTLVHGGETVFESDHIARYVVRAFDPSDRFGVRSERPRDLNRLAVINGVMNNEVVLILARRAGMSDLDRVAYFRKLTLAIDRGLRWLDAQTAADDEGFDYGDIALICLWQHLKHYDFAPDLDQHTRISARVSRFSARPSIAATTPKASLDEAAAAGWKPA